MIGALWVITAREVRFTPAGIDVLQIHDRVLATKFPVRVKEVTIVARLTGEPNEQFRVSVSMKDNDGREIRRLEGERTGKLDDKGYAFVSVAISGLRFTEPGRYYLALVSGKEVLAQTEYLAVLQETPIH